MTSYNISTITIDSSLPKSNYVANDTFAGFTKTIKQKFTETIKQKITKHKVNIEIMRKLEISEKSKFYSKMHDEIAKLSCLEDNWDSYGALFPNTVAVKNAIKISKCLTEKIFRPTRIMPVADGGISFLFVSENKFADIECDNDGDILAGMSTRGGEPDLWEVKESDADCFKTIGTIRLFLQNEDLNS